MAENSHATETAPSLPASAAKGAARVAPERRRLDAATAHLLAWLALALLNQPLLRLLLPRADVKIELVHHFYDMGQLLSLGVLSWAAIRGGQLVAERSPGKATARRGVQAVLLGAVVFLVGVLTASDDVSNLAERLDQPQWLLTVALAAAFALLLAASRLLVAFTSAGARAALASGGVALAIANALSLRGDYFACHLMAAWLSALLIAAALEGLSLPPYRRWQGRSALGLAAVVGTMTLIVPAKGDVQLRLQALPSTVLAPFIARLLPEDSSVSTERVSATYRNSAWFKSREGLPNVPATRAVVPAKPPIVMFFTIDAFRADVMEKRELRRKLPELTRLRQASSYFSVARSPTASTMTTMASVFSGKYYSQLHWSGNKQEPLIEKTPRFPELLAASGVRTLLVAGTLGQIYGKSGVARGFAKEVAIPPKVKPATQTVDAIIAELDAAPQAPLFIYSHFIEPHAPYNLAGKKGTAFQRYVAEIGLVDRELKRLRLYLEQKGLADHTYFIISADHGEGFGEHGTFNHARTAYEELVRVPFFLYLPGRDGRELATPVTLMDVGPTVLDLFGLPTPGFWMGQSLLPLAAGQTTRLERPVAVDTGRRVQALYLPDGHKVIFARLQHTTEVYDLNRDPGELTNLASSGSSAAQTAIETGELFFRAIQRQEAGYAIPEHKF